MEDPIGLISRLVGEVELGGQNRPVRRLHLDVDVARPAWIDARDDGFQPIEAILVGEQVAAQAVARLSY